MGTESGFNTYKASHKGDYCDRAMKQSVGFMHKFDPFPSMVLVGAGQYGHSQEFHVMLMDKYASNCDVTHGYCSLSSSALDIRTNDFKELADARKGITGFDVEVSNPYLLTQYLCTKIGTEPIAWGYKCAKEFAPYMSMINSSETTTMCINDWAATSEIYIEMSIADNWQFMGALFTTTLHSAYGFYPLCIKGANSDRINYAS